MRYTLNDLIEFCQVEVDEPLLSPDKNALAGMYLMYCALKGQSDLSGDDVKFIVNSFKITYDHAIEGAA